MVVPVFAGLHAMTATDALGSVEENASRLAIQKPSHGHEITVLLNQSLRGVLGHSISFHSSILSPTPDVYHFLFARVNKCGEEKVRGGSAMSLKQPTAVVIM